MIFFGYTSIDKPAEEFEFLDLVNPESKFKDLPVKYGKDVSKYYIEPMIFKAKN